MAIDAALRAILVDDGAVAALVGANVFVATAPQTTTPAYVLLLRPEPSLIDRHLNGRSGLVRDVWQIDCWAKDRVAADALGVAVRSAIEAASAQIIAGSGRATFATVELRSLRHQGRAQGFDPDLKLHVDRQAVAVWFWEP